MNTYSSLAGMLGLSFGMSLAMASCGGDRFSEGPENYSSHPYGGEAGHGGSGGGGIGGTGGMTGGTAGVKAGSSGSSASGGVSGMGGGGTTSGMGGIAGSSGFSGFGGSSGIGGKAGSAGIASQSGSGGMGGGVNVPETLRPAAGQTLPPTWSYLLWKDGPLPPGLTIAGYDVCSTTGPVTSIDNENECPNMAAVAESHYVLDLLSADAAYLWKVRTRFSDASMSAYSGIQTFMTDHSVVMWLRLDDGSGTMALDASGNGNGGTLVNSPLWIAGYVGEALQFGGTSYVSVPDTSSLNFGNADFTLSAQVKTSASGSRQAILEKFDSGNGYYFYILSTGVLGFFGASCGVAVSGGNVTDGQWHHVVATRSGSNVNLYVDGSMTGTGTCADSFSNASVLTIGCNSPSLGCVDPFGGEIDDVQIYNRALLGVEMLNDDCAAKDKAGGSLPAVCLP